jgi:hypothetical protein
MRRAASARSRFHAAAVIGVLLPDRRPLRSFCSRRSCSRRFKVLPDEGADIIARRAVVCRKTTLFDELFEGLGE